MTREEALMTLNEEAQRFPVIQEAMRVLIEETAKPAVVPTWHKARNHYEEPCIGSAFEKTGRRYTALYMGGYFIDLDDLFDKLPKEQNL